MVTASLLCSFMNLSSRERELTTLLYTLMTYVRHITLVIKSVGCMWARSITSQELVMTAEPEQDIGTSQIHR